MKCSVDELGLEGWFDLDLFMTVQPIEALVLLYIPMALQIYERVAFYFNILRKFQRSCYSLIYGNGIFSDI